MTKTYYPPFEHTPDNLEITSLEIEKLSPIMDDFIKISGMKNDLIIQDFTLNDNFLVGTITLWLRNQNEKFKSGVRLLTKFSTPTKGDNTGTFCEVLKYLYEWNTKNVIDIDGVEFITPQFPYSKESFAVNANNQFYLKQKRL